MPRSAKSSMLLVTPRTSLNLPKNNIFYSLRRDEGEKVLEGVELVAVEAGVDERRDGGAVRVVVEVRVRSTAHDAAAPLARIPHISESDSL